MPAELTDQLMLVAAEGTDTTLEANKAIGATSISIADASGWPTTTGFIFAIRVVDATGNEIAGTYTEWVGTLSGTTITMSPGGAPSPVQGTDQVYTAGATTQVYIPVSSQRENNLINALLSVFNQAMTNFTLSGNASIGGTLGVTGLTTLTGGFSNQTMAIPSAFRYYRSGAWTPGTGSILACDTEVFDNASDYNMTTGLFTARYSGLHILGGSVQYVNAGSAILISGLAKNGSTETSRFQETDTAPTGSTTQSGMTLLKLTAGDTVGLYERGYNTGGTGEEVTNFWGALLSKT